MRSRKSQGTCIQTGLVWPGAHYQTSVSTSLLTCKMCGVVVTAAYMGSQGFGAVTKGTCLAHEQEVVHTH